MGKKKVYLTFQTDEEIAFILKDFAHRIGKTQPELIDEICREYVYNLMIKMQEGIVDANTTEDKQLEEQQKKAIEALDHLIDELKNRT